MREVMPAVCWQVHRYDFARWREDRPAELGSYPPDLESWAGAYGERDGQRFLIGPDGRPDERVNAYLASPKMRNRAENTNKAYAYSLGVWLNFLLSTGLNWWEAGDDEVEAFQFWRLTDPRNGQILAIGSYPSFDPNDFAKPLTNAEYAKLKGQGANGEESPESPAP